MVHAKDVISSRHKKLRRRPNSRYTNGPHSSVSYSYVLLVRVSCAHQDRAAGHPYAWLHLDKLGRKIMTA